MPVTPWTPNSNIFGITWSYYSTQTWGALNSLGITWGGMASGWVPTAGFGGVSWVNNPAASSTVWSNVNT